MAWLAWLAVIVVMFVAVARVRLPFMVWTLIAAGILAGMGYAGFLAPVPGIVLWTVFAVIAVVMNVPVLRRTLLSTPMLARIRKVLPPMSDTERQAIDAGTVWWEAELFGGNPHWRRLMEVPEDKLSAEEQAFIDGPVEQLCGMLDDWKITHELNDLPQEVWDFLKRKGFFGMIIPKSYGGLEFSALAHSTVVMKVASRSGTAAVTVMVPNSLGPAELLLHYGTEEQKNYYLPRLANGEEIPAFALTSPFAGSDAGAMPDSGIVCKGQWEGKEVLGLRLNWNKRYITLGPVATVLGLAFKAYDPDHLLGDDEELGITCALIPTGIGGVQIGRRHAPLNSAFQNGPTWGEDVFIPLSQVIGGRDGVGGGWRMLMESLSAGRGISLPALGAASGKMAARLTGAYARIRTQFRLPIGRFEGVEEPLARIAGLTYMMDAGRRLTLAALDQGEKPSVVSAIVKYHLTEGMRQVINDAMDVHGGRGICMGPMNYLARTYQSVPITITVEGANILTRSMIIFGQGAMRCHPYIVRELEAIAQPDRKASERAFDKALFGHLGFTVSNAVRAFVYGLTRGRLAPSPVNGPTAKYYRRLARMSASFSFLADLALLFLGGALKRKEKLSGRFADALSFMYLCSASLKRFEDTGRPQADLPLVEWSAKYCLYQVQYALDEILRNFPMMWLGQVLRGLIFPLGRRFRYPNDALGHQVAALLLEPSETRDRLTDGIYISTDPQDITGRIEYTLTQALAAEPIERKLRDADLTQPPLISDEDWLQDVVRQGIIDRGEADIVLAARRAVTDAIQVDDFAPQALAASTAEEAA